MTNSSGISPLVSFKTEFDLHHSASLSSRDLDKVIGAIRAMTELQEKIQKTLQDIPQTASESFDWEQRDVTTGPLGMGICSQIQKKLNEIHAHLQSLLQSHPRAAGAGRTAQDLATGFGNLSANCWANAFLSMVVCVPHLRQAYLTVATHYATVHGRAPDQLHGTSLTRAITEYDTALAQRRPVHPEITQNVRLAFHHFFGYRNPVTQGEIFSQRAGAHEDAWEALQMIMGRYEEILRRHNPGNPAFVPLYSRLETVRYYRPVGEQRDADPSLVQRDAYSRLDQDNASKMICSDYQIFLDLQNRGHLNFSELLSDYFRCTSTSASDTAKYLLPNGRIQNFQLTREERLFLAVPGEFLLTLKRFGFTAYGQSCKITTPVNINRILILPPAATPQNAPIAYALDSFIVHSGGTGGGHYLCYKKIGDLWIEANDSALRCVTPEEIDQILHGQKTAAFTSYMHHYTLIPDALQRVVLEMHNLQERGPLSHAIWLHDQTPYINNYGQLELDSNPERLLQITLPWLLGKAGTPLLDQWIAVRGKKQEIADAKFKQDQLQAFLSKLNNSSLTNQELLHALQALPQPIQWELHGLIYRAHKSRFGEEHVHQQEYRNEYGKVTLEQAGNLRDTLLQARESVIDTSGDNIVAQLVISTRIHGEKLQKRFEKEQLEAFSILLQPAHALTHAQLIGAFERFEIREENRKWLYEAIWRTHGQKPIHDYGKTTFYENPRCVLATQDPTLAQSESCPLGGSILDQLIAHLD